MKATKKEKEDAQWNEKFKALLEYKAETGNCKVPIRYKQNPKLARWVSNQRKYYKNEKMSQDRIDKLEGIAFLWKPERGGLAAARKNEFDESWNDMFEQLKVFRVETGNCNVPKIYKSNLKLGRWVHTQRQKQRNKKLSLDQINKLEEIGFDWKPATGGAAVAAAKLLKNESISLEGISQSTLPMPPLPPLLPLLPFDANTKQINTVTHEQDAARGMLESIETEKDSSGIATKDMEFLNIEALWDKLTANEALIVRVMSYLKKKELKPLFCSAKCFSFGNDNTWGILWKEKFCLNGICLWKEPPERADMTWREYYHHMVQYKINKSEEFLRNNAESYLASPRRPLDRFTRLELKRAEDSFNFTCARSSESIFFKNIE